MTPANTPSWLESAVFYQIYPQSFCDSNGDGIGDLPGIISKLPYLRQLGITAIWLNPFFESPFGDAGYDITDFLKVAPRYGTNEDAIQLFREAHQHGIRVILDLVAGHTSIQHPWFRDSSQANPGPFRDRYIWTDTPWEALWQPGFIIGNCSRPAAYHANFFYFQASLNYGFAHPDPDKPWQQPPDAPGPMATRAALRDIMKFWLEAGCDGFRVDMAYSLIKNDTDFSANIALWQDFRKWFDTHWPDAVLISEWGDPRHALRAGFHADFLLHFHDPSYRLLMAPCIEPPPPGQRFYRPCYFQASGGLSVRAFLKHFIPQLEAARGRGYLALPTANHDFSRPTFGRSLAEIRPLLACLFTLPAIPFLYYGDEIGMRCLTGLPSKEGGYGRTATRTPMQWDASQPNLGFSTAPPEKLYLPVDPAPDAPSVSAQQRSTHSLLNLTKSLIALRKNHPALSASGGFAPLYISKDGRLFIYERNHPNERLAIAINPDPEPRRTQLSFLLKAEPLLAEGMSLRGRNFSLDPFSWAILRLPEKLS